MASTGLDHPTSDDVRSTHRDEMNEKTVAYGVDDNVRASSPISDDSDKPLIDSTHRKLKPRHIQLIGIGGYLKTISCS